MRFPFSFLKAGVPAVLSTLSLDLSDTDGDAQPIILTGTGFTGTAGAAGVKFGATNAASYVVDSNTQITATPPAASAGTVNVTVNNGNGASNGISYEFWSPVVENPVVFFEKDYVITTGNGVWTARHVRGSQVAATISENSSATPDAAGVYPDFEASTADRLEALGATKNVDDYIGFGDFTILAAVNVESNTLQGANQYDLPSIASDVSGYMGLQIGQVVLTTYVQMWQFDGAPKYARISLGASPQTGARVFAAKKEGGNLKITVNGTAWTTGDACGAMDGGSATSSFILGATIYTPVYYDGIEKAIVTDDVAWTDAKVLKFYKWTVSKNYD